MDHCELDFVCSKRWNELTPTDRADARHCGECDQHVFNVDTDGEVELARMLGRCAGRDADQLFGLVGRSYARLTDPKLLAVGVRLVQPLTDARTLELRYAFPALFDRGERESRLRSGALVMLEILEADILKLLTEELEDCAPELQLSEPTPEPRESGTKELPTLDIQAELFDDGSTGLRSLDHPGGTAS